MHFVISGGCGFLGSHLVRRLAEASNNNIITVIDDLSTGSIKNLVEHPRVEFIYEDISTPYADWSDKIANIPIDVIYNLACPASPVAYQKTPIKTTMTSVAGTYNLLNLATLEQARFFQASTSEVYGDPEIHPQPESYWGNVNSFGPRSCYDEGKRCAEALVHDFYYQRGTDVRIARIFNTYGPNMAMNDGRVVSNFLVQALKGEDITIYGDGSQTRSFCYVDDLIDGFLVLMSNPFGGPTNIGNPKEFTMLELAQKCLTITQSSSKLVFKDLPVDDPTQRCPDIYKMELVGWKPTIPLDEGLLKTAAYFRSELNGMGF